MTVQHPVGQDTGSILFIDLSIGNTSFPNIYQETKELLNGRFVGHLQITTSMEDTLDLLQKSETQFDVTILWATKKDIDQWKKLFLWLESYSREASVIVVFDFAEDVTEIAREITVRDGYVFACPFNTGILGAYIESSVLFVRSTVQLRQIEDRYWEEGRSMEDILRITFEELRTNPLIGYQRATISLFSPDTGDRYLLAHDGYPNPDRSLLKNAYEDSFILQVLDNGVVIHSDLDIYRTVPDDIESVGWDDVPATRDIKSWVGLALECNGEEMGIVTLDYTESGHYGRYGDRTLRYLDGFRRVLGEVISSYFQDRNARIIQQITEQISEILHGRALLRRVLIILRDAFGCDNCTFFRTTSSLEDKEIYLSEWVGANDQDNLPERTNPRIFKKNEGVVGSILVDGQSRIIPHALESREFKFTPGLPGTDVSMLAVPMKAFFPGNFDNQVMGVICCYKKRATDFFTIYDRNLIENVAQQVAMAIQRTLILENLHKVSNDINESLLTSDMDGILRNICEHALRVTTATEAVIHRFPLPLNDASERPRVVINNYWYPNNSFRKAPRLDGTGATDEVLQQGHMTQFSEEDKNMQMLSPGLQKLNVKHVLGVPLTIREEEQKQLTIGVLYLNKYVSGRFSKIEEFAVELFANHAANAIYTLESLYGLRTLSKASASMNEAIKNITKQETRGLILYNITKQANILASAKYSYLTLRSSKGRYDFEAAYPERYYEELAQRVEYFDYVHGNQKQGKKGITGLAAENGKSILIPDIKREIEENTERIQEYIDFGLNSRSELAVPIIYDNEVLGVINLEHSDAYAFTKEHVRIVELFAQHAAIALQRNQLIKEIKEQNKRLLHLQESLQTIVRAAPEDMLLKAVSLTAQATGAEAVIFIPIRRRILFNQGADLTDTLKHQRPNLLNRIEIDPDLIVSNDANYHAMRSRLSKPDPVTLHVFTTKQTYFVSSKRPTDSETSEERLDIPEVMINLGMRTGLCLPLISRQHCIGVMWLHFEDVSRQDPPSREIIAVYESYANQIALAYTNAQQSAELRQRVETAQKGITQQIDKHYKDARFQSLLYFIVALISSITGAFLVLRGGFLLFSGSLNEPWQAVFSVIVGTITEAVGIFVYTQARAAHDRMDRYHEELFRLRKLDILMLAAEELEADAEQSKKAEIISRALDNWLHEAARDREISK